MSETKNNQDNVVSIFGEIEKKGYYLQPVRESVTQAPMLTINFHHGPQYKNGFGFGSVHELKRKSSTFKNIEKALNGESQPSDLLASNMLVALSHKITKISIEPIETTKFCEIIGKSEEEIKKHGISSRFILGGHPDTYDKEKVIRRSTSVAKDLELISPRFTTDEEIKLILLAPRNKNPFEFLSSRMSNEYRPLSSSLFYFTGDSVDELLFAASYTSKSESVVLIPHIFTCEVVEDIGMSSKKKKPNKPKLTLV